MAAKVNLEPGKTDTEISVLVEDLRRLAMRRHHYCEDSWYSCPKHAEGCADENAGKECNCGAEKHNAKVMEVYENIRSALGIHGG